MTDILERYRKATEARVIGIDWPALAGEMAKEIERLCALVKIIEQNDTRRGPSYPPAANDYCFGPCLMPALRAALNPHLGGAGK